MGLIASDINLVKETLAYLLDEFNGRIDDSNLSRTARIAYAKLTLTNSIVNADVSSTAAIAYSKLAALTSAHILVGSSGNVATDVAVTGDVTISNTGVTAIGTNKVTAPMLATTAIHLGSATATSTSSITSEVDITNATVTVTVPAGGRDILVMAHVQGSNNTATTLLSINIKEDGSTLKNIRLFCGNNTNSFTTSGYVIKTPSAGSHTYKLTAAALSGTGVIDAATTIDVLMI